MSDSTPITDKQWTEQKCLDLIMAYQQQQILWDQSNVNYFNKLEKAAAWKFIGAKLGIPASQCKHKMGVLLSSFRREKAKIMKNNPCVSSWFGFQAMSFLLIKPKNTQPPHLKRKKNYVQPGTPIVKITRHAEPATNQIDQTTNNQPTSSKSQVVLDTNDEEIKLFSTFIGTKMKKYSETTKNAVQQAICEIIFKADSGFYEATNKNSTPPVQDWASKSKEIETLILKMEDSDSIDDSDYD